MIIRSQDKKSITTDLNLCIYEDDWTHQFEVSNNIGMDLGTYSTEEKAINVLDMIQQEFCDYGENGAFNMPSDEEVEV